MKITEKILNIVKEAPISRKELIEKAKKININENRLDVCVYKLVKKGLLIKKENLYFYVNPFTKVFEIENLKERELKMYKTFLGLISPGAKWKPLILFREAVYLNNKRGKI